MIHVIDVAVLHETLAYGERTSTSVGGAATLELRDVLAQPRDSAGAIERALDAPHRADALLDRNAAMRMAHLEVDLVQLRGRERARDRLSVGVLDLVVGAQADRSQRQARDLGQR